MPAMMKLRNITVKTATRTAVSDVSLDIPQSKIVALLGPNGAGKSELVSGVAGVSPLSSGNLHVDDEQLTGRSVQGIRAAGIAAIPEGHQTLKGLSVMDNLTAAGTTLNATELTKSIDETLTIFPELKALVKQKAGSLSGGQQQMVAIAQAIVSRPKFLLIDEMSLGLAPVVIERLLIVVQSLRDSGIGVLLIEQFTQLALSIADYCYVLSDGEIQFSGAPKQLLDDKTILERAYLGSS